MQASEECPSVVSVDLSGSRPGAPELQSGHALETKSRGRGMEAAPSNGELHMASFWRSGSGFIRIEHDYALPAMVLPIPPIAPGTGRSSPRMAQNKLVCLTSDPAYSNGAIQNTVGQSVATAAGSSVVDRSAVVCGTDQSVSGLSVGDPPQTGHAVASTGNDLAPTARFMEIMGMASERSELICPGLSAEVTETIINSRAVSTRSLSAFKWKLFTTWCRRCDMDPAYCHIAWVLEFLQSCFSERITPATLKVYEAAISANHAYIGGVSVGRHPLVSRFIQGARRLRPFCPARVPS